MKAYDTLACVDFIRVLFRSEVIGSSTITGNASLSGGQVTVDGGQTLTLDDVTVTDSTITDTGTRSEERRVGKECKSPGSTSGGKITNLDTIDIATGTTTISNDAFANTGAL